MEQSWTKLTEAEKEALRAYLVSSDIKKVARAIGRSHHTVRQRLERARKKLAATRTLDAALILARAEGMETWTNGIYPDRPHGPESIADATAAVPEDGGGSLPLPFPTKGRPWNALSSSARLVWIAIGILLLAISVMAVVSLGEATSRVVRQLR